MNIKKKDLEISLQQVPPPPTPSPRLEQYTTPAPIAADIIFTAYQLGDIQERSVLDLGCGTGIFAVGAALAGAKDVAGIDIDPTLIAIAKAFSTRHHLRITYHVQDIKTITQSADTVLMNPPFGAQKANQGADRRFLEKATQIAPVTYSLHLTKTIPFLHTLITALHADITLERLYQFPIPAQFTFHTKLKATQDITLLRIVTHHSK